MPPHAKHKVILALFGRGGNKQNPCYCVYHTLSKWYTENWHHIQELNALVVCGKRPSLICFRCNNSNMSKANVSNSCPIWRTIVYHRCYRITRKPYQNLTWTIPLCYIYIYNGHKKRHSLLEESVERLRRTLSHSNNQQKYRFLAWSENNSSLPSLRSTSICMPQHPKWTHRQSVNLNPSHMKHMEKTSVGPFK